VPTGVRARCQGIAIEAFMIALAARPGLSFIDGILGPLC